MLLHGGKITIIMEQDVVILDAECANDNGGRFADRDAQSSQSAIIPGGADRELRPDELNERIPAQCTLDTRGMFLIPRLAEPRAK